MKKSKLLKNKNQYLFNVFILCLIISFTVIYFLGLFLPNKSSEDIATTIAGVLGTAFSFFGSILVYKALMSQIKANEQVRKQFELQEKNSLIESRINYFEKKILMIKDEINGFYYSLNESTGMAERHKHNYEGSQAIYKLLDNVKNHHLNANKNQYLVYPKLGELKSLLYFFNSSINDLKIDKLLSVEHKKSIFETAEYLYNSKLSYIFISLDEHKSKHNGPCPSCGDIHGIPLDLFELFEKIKEVFKV